MLQAALVDCQFLDLLPFSEDGFVATEVDVSGCDVARDIRKTDACMTSFIQRRKVERLFAHLKRYIGLRMMRLRG
ncbi:MAG: hypothetical protein WBN04_19275, partial [Paracoccaceae bacterium]